MYILKNAVTSIVRNKGRNLLIGIIVIVISCATAVTLAIRSSANSLIHSYENQYELSATIEIDRESMHNGMNKELTEEERQEQREKMEDIFSEASDISLDDIKNYGDSKLVKEYYYQNSIGVNSSDIESASMTESSDGRRMGNHGKGGFQNIDESDFTLTGYSTINAMNDFIQGRYTITSGEINSDMNSSSAVINNELASLNNIKVGDEIKFVDPKDDENEVKVKITGIFEEKSDTDEQMGMFANSANTIITNTTVIDKFLSKREDMKNTITPTFILKDKTVIEQFEKELKEKGLNEYLNVTTNLDQVEGATSTISNVATFATTFLIITLIIGGIVLFVINMINIRERKYEIGVLRTIGMKKRYLTLQFILELMIVSFIALLIGAGLGAASSVSVSNHLLQNEITNAQQERENINDHFGGRMDDRHVKGMNGIVSVQAVTSIDAVVDFKVLLNLLGIGLILTLISSTAAMISIQKFSPLTILKERS